MDITIKEIIPLIISCIAFIAFIIYVFSFPLELFLIKIIEQWC